VCYSQAIGNCAYGSTRLGGHHTPSPCRLPGHRNTTALRHQTAITAVTNSGVQEACERRLATSVHNRLLSRVPTLTPTFLSLVTNRATQGRFRNSSAPKVIQTIIYRWLDCDPLRIPNHHVQMAGLRPPRRSAPQEPLELFAVCLCQHPKTGKNALVRKSTSAQGIQQCCKTPMLLPLLPVSLR
jgi:hypothetical protein